MISVVGEQGGLNAWSGPQALIRESIMGRLNDYSMKPSMQTEGLMMLLIAMIVPMTE